MYRVIYKGKWKSVQELQYYKLGSIQTLTNSLLLSNYKWYNEISFLLIFEKYETQNYLLGDFGGKN